MLRSTHLLGDCGNLLLYPVSLLLWKLFAVAVPEHTEEPLVHLRIAMRRQQLMRNSKSLHSERWASQKTKYENSGSTQDGGDKGRAPAGTHSTTMPC